MLFRSRIVALDKSQHSKLAFSNALTYSGTPFGHASRSASIIALRSEHTARCLTVAGLRYWIVVSVAHIIERSCTHEEHLSQGDERQRHQFIASQGMHVGLRLGRWLIQSGGRTAGCWATKRGPFIHVCKSGSRGRYLWPSLETQATENFQTKDASSGHDIYWARCPVASELVALSVALLIQECTMCARYVAILALPLAVRR